MTTTSPAEPPKIISLEQAEKVLAPYRERLNRCIQHGWDVWKSDYAHKHIILHARARAAIVFDEIVDCAMSEFTDSDLTVKRTPSTFMLYIGDSIVLRFKKIGKSGRCSNILTKQQILFRAQQIIQLPLPTMEKPTLVHAGYLLDDLQQDILRKSIVAQYNNSVVWQLSLNVGVAEVVKLVPTPAITSRAKPRFEAKPELVVTPNGKKVAGEDE